ncbi:MAG: PhoU domain-containing protein [Desulfovermiculus sp.]|nr:PhoU domain-containing protein [Desulfovermiculus sp.]
MVGTGLHDNFQFLILDVVGLIRQTSTFLLAPEAELYEHIVSRDDYIDNLKNNIENSCFTHIASATQNQLSTQAINTYRCIQTIAVNLERIADYCVNIVQQVQYLSDADFLQEFDYQSMIREILVGMDEISGALKEKSFPRALRICRTENTLDRMCKTRFDRIMEDLQKGPDRPGDYMTTVFIVRYLERIGDSLLNIGEAILFAIIGEKIKIHQFQALQENLNKSGLSTEISEMDLTYLWGSRSGCRIGRVENKEHSQSKQGSIFKEGISKKIRREKKCLERWQQIFPGLVPKIFSFYEDEKQDTASLLLELLPGCTVDETLVTTDMDTVRNTFFILREVLEEVWTQTLIRQKTPSKCIPQLRKRLTAVLQVHPRFKRTSQQIGNTKMLSTGKLLQASTEIESELAAPLSVYIHGDFNINNVVYSHSEQKIHFIDLHRSTQGDYVQDVSVFLVSNFRIPVFEPSLRSRLNWMTRSMFEFAQDFAQTQGDSTFQARMALALARSFYTSTRFELKLDFAKTMFLRSHFLLDQLITHRGQGWDRFVLPEDVLYY